MATDITEKDQIGEINKYNFRTETKDVFRAQKGLSKCEPRTLPPRPNENTRHPPGKPRVRSIIRSPIASGGLVIQTGLVTRQYLHQVLKPDVVVFVEVEIGIVGTAGGTHVVRRQDLNEIAEVDEAAPVCIAKETEEVVRLDVAEQVIATGTAVTIPIELIAGQTGDQRGVDREQVIAIFQR